MNFCAKHSLHLISDEIFALSTFEEYLPSSLDVPFTSTLSCSSNLDVSQIHVMYGLSKDFAAGGLRIGCVASHNTLVHDSVRAIARYSWPSVLSCAMAATILEDTVWGESAESRRRVAEAYLLTVSELRRNAECSNSSAAVFVWADFSPLLRLLRAGDASSSDMFGREKLLGKRFIDEGVFLEPAGHYHGSRPGWFRLVYTCERTELLEALRRIIEVCNQIRNTS